MKVGKGTILAAIVPIIFLIGVFSFFIFLPPELRSLTNFIAYLSGLSSSIMVLVYLVTYSRQLDTMSKQLSEMKFARDVQVQPLPYLQQGKASMLLPSYYVSPSNNFKKMELCSFVQANFNIINHGNGPAIGVDFIPHLLTGSKVKKPEILDKDILSAPVDCVPLKTETAQTIEFNLDDKSDGQKILEALTEDKRIAIDFSITYKNALGKPFLEEIAFWLNVMSEKDLENIKLALKLTRTASIDFATELQKYEKIAAASNEVEQVKLLDEVNKKINAILGQDKVELGVGMALRSFKVRSISEDEYRKWLDEKAMLEENIKKEIRGCWEAGTYKILENL
jgi:hypothetical protein